ncbi:MAG: nucleotidyltransferase domain-containing protein [Alphaproteobacteria bacterium]
MDKVVIEPAIRAAARRLAEASGADAVILFGSRARGDNEPDSDWDLCVLLPDDIAPQQFTPSKLWDLVSDMGVPIQVCPVRRSVFEFKKNDVNSLSYDVAREGVALVGSVENRVVAADPS